MVAAEHIDDVPQLFNFIEVSRHRIGGWFHHVPGFHGAGYHSSASFRHALFLSLGGLMGRSFRSDAPGALAAAGGTTDVR